MPLNPPSSTGFAASFELEDPGPDLNDYAGDDLDAYCRDLYTEYEGSAYRKDKLDKIAIGRKRYKGARDPKNFPWKDCSNVSVMLDAIAVDNLEPRIKAQLIGEDDFIQVEPVGEEDAENAESAQDFMHWAVHNNIRLSERVKPMVHDLLLDGTKDVIPIWREQLKTVRVRVIRPIFVDQQGQQVPVPPKLAPKLQSAPQQMQRLGLRIAGYEDSFEERQTSEFKVELDMVDLSDAFFPDTWENWDEMPYLRFIYPTLDELYDLSEENGGPYSNISEDLLSYPGQARIDNADQTQEEQGIKHSEYTREIRLLECYVKWRGEWTITTYALDSGWENVRKQPLRDVYWHGQKPVYRFRIYPEEKESMGVGLPEKIEHHSKGIDDLYNQMVDSGTIEIIPWFFYQETPGFSDIDLAVTPGKGIPIGKDSQVTFPNIGGKAAQFLTFIEAILGFFERSISLSDWTHGGKAGSPGQGAETYSGMALVVQEGNIKHQYMGETLRDRFGKLLNACLSLYAQNMPLDAKKRIFDGNKWVFESIDALSIQGNFDLKIEISNASANKMLNRKERVELMNMSAKNPVINIVKVTEDLLKAYDIKDASEYIKPEFRAIMQAVMSSPEVVQVIQQYLVEKGQKMRDTQIANEAQANIRRQAIERGVEAPVEMSKLEDQVTEAVKRSLIKKAVEGEIGKRQRIPGGQQPAQIPQAA